MKGRPRGRVPCLAPASPAPTQPTRTTQGPSLSQRTCYPYPCRSCASCLALLCVIVCVCYCLRCSVLPVLPVLPCGPLLHRWRLPGGRLGSGFGSNPFRLLWSLVQPCPLASHLIEWRRLFEVVFVRCSYFFKLLPVFAYYITTSP